MAIWTPSEGGTVRRDACRIANSVAAARLRTPVFAQHPHDVDLDRVEAEEELLGDLGVARARRPRAAAPRPRAGSSSRQACGTIGAPPESCAAICSIRVRAGAASSGTQRSLASSSMTRARRCSRWFREELGVCDQGEGTLVGSTAGIGERERVGEVVLRIGGVDPVSVEDAEHAVSGEQGERLPRGGRVRQGSGGMMTGPFDGRLRRGATRLRGPHPRPARASPP